MTDRDLCARAILNRTSLTLLMAMCVLSVFGGSAHATGIDGDATSSSFTITGPVSISSLTVTNSATLPATTLTGSASFSNTSLYGIVGSTTNDNAASGNVGQFVSGSAGPVTLSGGSGSYNAITSISLGSGDWDVEGMIVFRSGASTSTTYSGPNTSYIGTQSNASDGSVGVNLQYAEGVSSSWSFGSTVPRQRLSLSSTTTVYLVAQATYSGSNPQAWGSISARRAR